MPIALYALALAAFAVGTAEFIIAGLLPTMAADLSVSIPTTGLLVTGYALGVAFGGPILALLTAHLPRRPMILSMVALYALGHVFCAIAPNYTTLLIARVLVALTHGLFFGNATIAAANVVPFERRGSAISIVLAGVPLANLLGVPFGAAIGHWLGWRASFWGVAALATIAFVAIALTLPKIAEERTEPVAWRSQIRVLFRHEIALSYLALFLFLIGTLAFNTFQVPFLINMTGVPEADTPPYLFAYGAGAIAGIILGGRLPIRMIDELLRYVHDHLDMEDTALPSIHRASLGEDACAIGAAAMPMAAALMLASADEVQRTRSPLKFMDRLNN